MMRRKKNWKRLFLSLVLAGSLAVGSAAPAAAAGTAADSDIAGSDTENAAAESAIIAADSNAAVTTSDSDTTATDLDSAGTAADSESAESNTAVTVSDSEITEAAVLLTAQSDAQKTAVTVLDGAATSNNVSDNNYTYWASTVKSYLYENEDGTLTRVEYISGTGICVEEIDPDTGEVTSSQTLSMELSIWGGFYSGEEYNFIVVGQTNSDESNSVEVIRVIRYTKDWTRVDACSIYGANTYIPFDAGSLRMTELDGSLYLYTCHEMYETSDGYHHQANMTFVVDEDSMKVTDSYYSVMNNAYGYVSHSFNQFIQTDGEYIYRVDHGDAYPRGIYLSRCAVGSSVTRVSYTTVFSIQGSTGANATGVSVGGFELSENNCLIVGNSVDQSSSSSYSASGQRNIFLTVTGKTSLSSTTIWLTDYTSSDSITPRTPQLVKISDDEFLILWEEYQKKNSTSVVTTSMVLVDGSGNLLSDIVSTTYRLSDCQPIVTEDGIVIWYVSDGSDVVLYQIDPDNLEDYAQEYIWLTDEDTEVVISGVQDSYEYTGSAIVPDDITVTVNGTELTLGEDYTLSGSSKSIGTGTVTITGMGIYLGSTSVTFQIVGNLENTEFTTVTLKTKNNLYYTGSALTIEDAYSLQVSFHSTRLTEGEDYTLSYENNVSIGDATLIITGIGNYTGTVEETFTIYGSISDAEVEAIADQEYTGAEVTPAVNVTCYGETLTEGEDYTLSYSNNVKAGTASVKITGTGYYKGSQTVTFAIVVSDTGSTSGDSSDTDTGTSGSGSADTDTNSGSTGNSSDTDTNSGSTGNSSDTDTNSGSTDTDTNSGSTGGNSDTDTNSGSTAETEYGTGLYKVDGTWYYYVDGEVATSYTGLANNSVGWWYVNKGLVDFSYTGFCYYNGYYWYVSGGNVKFVTGVYKVNGTWYYVKNGARTLSYTGLAKNDYGWWYVNQGVVDFSYTGFCYYNGSYWYVSNGNLKFVTGVYKVNGTWYYVKNGVQTLTYTGLAKNDYGWWYVNQGVVDFSYTGLCYYNGSYWYVSSGNVKFVTGLYKINGTWYYLMNGAWALNYYGMATNSAGTWFVQGGIITFHYTGTVTINGKTYTVKNSKVTS